MTNVTNTHKEFDIYEVNKIKLKINPFPAGMYEAMMTDIINDNPLPEIPKKEITVFGDKKEMVDDETGEYKKEKSLVEKTRERLMSEKIMKFVLNECLEVTNKNVMNKDIKRLSEYIRFPNDEKEKEVKYISAYVLKTKTHYERVIKTAIALSVVDDKEVAERLESFPD